MQRPTVSSALARCLCFAAIALASFAIARADEVVLEDGTRLVGEVQQLQDGKLVVTTKYAGDVTVDAAGVVSITTDEPRVVALESGDRVVGRLEPDAEGAQRVVATEIGDVTVTPSAVAALLPPTPENLSATPVFEKPDWSVTLQAGIDGSTGNTERTAFRGRLDITRETPDDRLFLYAAGQWAKLEGVRSENEVIGGARLEVDVSEKLFVYGRGELEHDEFENLALRSTVAGGLGYFLIEEDDTTFKLRGGVGYQHESFQNDTTDDAAIGELGYDFATDVQPWLTFTHGLTWYPTFEDLGDYRLAADTAAVIPISNDERWKLRLGVRNEYDARPEPGIERLDTTYYANIVLELD